MKNSIFLLVFLLLASSTNINSQVSQEWISKYNGPGNGTDNPLAIAVDHFGNVYVTGYSPGSGTSEDCTTIKYAPSGVQLWAQRYNGPGNGYDVGLAIAFDGSGYIYVTGYSLGIGTDIDCITIKYNTSGVQQWVQRYDAGNRSDHAYAIVIDAPGNIYITGGSVASGINEDYVTVKYDSAGVQQWVQRYNGPGNSYDHARRIAIDSSGNICVTGYSLGIDATDDYATIKYNSSGVQQWVQRYNGPANNSDRASSIAIDNSGNVYVSGTSYGNGTMLDGATIKYSSSGIEQWVQRYNGPENLDDYLNEIGLDGFGNVYITGSSYGNAARYNYATMKYSPSGTQLWIQIYNGPSNSDDASYDIAVDNLGNAYVTGSSMDTMGNWSGVRYATVKYSPSGSREWVQRFTPQQGTAAANDIAIDGSGNVYVTGLSTGNGTSDDYTTIKYSQHLTGIHTLSNEIPKEYRLKQNFPNPFNSATKIRFALPKSLFAKLVVYDMLGREIETLVNEQLNAGTYEADWSADKFSSGVYYYKLFSDEFIDTKKMILIK